MTKGRGFHDGFACDQLPTTSELYIEKPNSYCLMTINHPAVIGPRGPRPRPPFSAAGGAPAGGAGAGPRSGWKRYALCVFGSTVIVFAPGNVSTVATTVYWSAESW